MSNFQKVTGWLCFSLQKIQGHDGVSFDSISAPELEQIQLPLPPDDILRNIVKECENLDTVQSQQKILEEGISLADIPIAIKAKKQAVLEKWL